MLYHRFALLVLPLLLSGPARADAPPVKIEARYVAEGWSNLSGGAETGSRYIDGAFLTLGAVPWAGATVVVTGYYGNGKEITSLVGKSQSVSSIETGVQQVRLLEGYLDQRFLEDAVSLRLGLWDLNEDFDSTASRGLFLNGAHGFSGELAQIGFNGPSTFPYTGVSARLAFQYEDSLRWSVAVTEGEAQDPARPKRTTVDLRDGEGLLILTEAAWTPNDRTKVAVGAWHHTARIEPRASVFAGTPADGRKNSGAYAVVDWAVTRETGDVDQGLNLFARGGVARSGQNEIPFSASVGAVYTGLFEGRDGDQLGLAINVNWIDLLSRDTSGPTPITRRNRATEIDIEATYRAVITPWLAIQPNAQVTIRPGGLSTPGTALTLGLRAEFTYATD
jgi:porin